MNKNISRIICIILALLMLLGIGGAGFYYIFMNPYRETVDSFAPSLEFEAALIKEEAAEAPAILCI